MPAYLDYAGVNQNAPGGHYRLGFKSGLVTGLSAGDAVFAFRWTDATRFLRLLEVTVSAAITTAFGTAQRSDIELFLARNWTTGPTAGVSLTAPSGAQNTVADLGVATGMAQLPSLLSNTLANNVAIANTGALTTGTLSADTNPAAHGIFNIIALGSADRVTLYKLNPQVDYPITFGANEGFTLNVPTAQGATGVVAYYVNLSFAVNNQTF